MSSLPVLSKNRLLQFGEQFAYSLTDENNFARTEYKVINNEKSLNILPCAKIQFNDQNLMFFLPSGIPLRKIQKSIGVHEYRVIMTRLLEETRKIQAHGFLDVRNIDLSPSRIFIRSEDLSVTICYVPCREHLHSDQNDFSKNLKRLFLQILAENPSLQNKEGLTIREAIKECQGNPDSLLEILARKQDDDEDLGSMTTSIGDERRAVLVLKSVNPAFNLMFRIEHERFVLGRKAEAVNGVISGSPLVGRVHAVITRSNGRYYINDLKSKNGTFVNDQQVVRPTLIGNGDILRFGNVPFRAQFM